MPDETRREATDDTLARKARIRPAPEAPAAKMRSSRRLPATLGGAALGFLAFLLFWIQMAVSFDAVDLLFQAAGALFLVACLVAVFFLLLRKLARDRWRPRRKVKALDTSAWAELARTRGIAFESGKRPRLHGDLDGITVQLGFHRVGGARTEGRATRPTALPATLRINPRKAEYGQRSLVPTGDDEFDRRFRVESADRELVRCAVTEEVRRLLMWLEDVRVTARGTAVRATVPRFLDDPQRLETLLDLLVALA